MRIVDVCAFYTPHGGGVKTYIDRKLAAGTAAGHEIVVIAPGERDAVEERFPGARIVWLASPPLPFDRRYRYFHDEAALHGALDRVRPAMIEASSPWSSAAMVGRWQGSAPRALVMHADPLSAYAYRWFGGLASINMIDRGFARYWNHLRRLDAAYDLIVSASGNLTDRLRAGGVTRATTVPMGVEPGLFSPGFRDADLRAGLLRRCGLGPDATLLVGVGRYSAEKRWGMVIDAVHAAGTQRSIGLVLIGDGRGRRGLVARAAGSPHVVVGEAIRDRTTLARTMASADALVHGCEAETFCMVAAEARASALPLIVPDRGGAADHARGADDRRYRAADGASLRDTIVAFAGRQVATRVPDAPRTMDDHFDELFAAYADLRAPAVLAA
ncbi:glycosyltransferase [uncultured Sphingomonas sp.]|uniref:glycosyltransferase n=1 Tax=uncultured Sphingomonas sp. TaxID=158754 RepID=UPI0035CC6036